MPHIGKELVLAFLSVTVHAHAVKYFLVGFCLFIITPNLQVRVGGVPIMIVAGWYHHPLFTYFCRLIVSIFVYEWI